MGRWGIAGVLVVGCTLVCVLHAEAVRPPARSAGWSLGGSAACGLEWSADCALRWTGVVLRSAELRDAQRVVVPREKVIIDTDIGDDIDDAFAVSLALDSPEVEIDGITTAWGDTHLRAKLVERLLAAAGDASIPVAEGIATHSKVHFTQARWAEGGPEPRERVDAVDFMLREIRAHPGEITIVAIAPLTNIAAAIDRDPETFRKVKRIVMMGGSIYRGYEDPGAGPNLISQAPLTGDLGALPTPDPEYNIVSDIAAAQKVFQSGVAIFEMPLDSTQLRLDEVKRGELFARGTPITDALTLLYHQWGQQTPVLYDAMAMAFVLDDRLCPVRPMKILVDKDGYTRVGEGKANAAVCVKSDADQFFRFLMPRLMEARGDAKPQ